MKHIPRDARISILVHRELFWDNMALYIVARTTDGAHLFQGEFSDTPLDEFAQYPEPQVILNPEVAQRLMDNLWDCGLRPTEGKGSAGALAATEKHLADMRQISTQLLNDKLRREP